MDFDVSAAQTDALNALRSAIGEHANVTGRPAVADACDPDLERFLGAHQDVLDPGFVLLDRILLVEEAARLGARINGVATLLLRPMLGEELPPGPLALRIASADAPIRFGRHAVGVVDVTGDAPTFGEADPSGFTAVASGAVCGYGAVVIGPAVAMRWDAVVAPMTVFQLGRAAEIAGAARGALDLTVSYLNRREQFGRRLSSFQALRHRLSELAVDVEATSTLVRTAAYAGTTTAMLGAASYAVDAASRSVPELHQLSGARGFMFESGLPAMTMRLVATRVELTGVGVSPIAYADAVWAP